MAFMAIQNQHSYVSNIILHNQSIFNEEKCAGANLSYYHIFSSDFTEVELYLFSGSVWVKPTSRAVVKTSVNGRGRSQ